MYICFFCLKINLFHFKEEEIWKVHDEWMMYESDDKVEEIGENNHVYHWWYSIFKIKTLIGERKCPMLEKLIKSVLSLHHVMESSLSDNNNTVQTERINMLEETIISLEVTSATKLFSAIK